MDEDTRKILTELLDEKLEPVTKMLEKHDATLYGNGKPGLVTIVYQLQAQVGKGAGLWDKVVEYLVIAGISALVVLIITHGITP